MTSHYEFIRPRVDMTAVPSQEEILSRHYQAWSAPSCVPIDMLAAEIDSSSRSALSRRRQMKSICRTVQVLPECLRLSKVPAVHCKIANNEDQTEIHNKGHSPNE